MVSLGFVISLWAGSSAISAFVDSVVEAHDQTPLRHPVRQRFFALGLYVVMLVFVIAAAPFVALGPRKISSYLPDSWDNVLQYGYYPTLVLALVLAVTILYRVSLPKPLPTHRLVWGAILATTVFVVATMGLRFYLTWITSTGYTYGALATPIAFLLFAFFLGFAIMIGAELNAAIEEEWPAPTPHADQVRTWLRRKAKSLGDKDVQRRSRSRSLTRRPRPRRSALLEVLVDALAVRADRRPRLGRAGHREHLTAQRDDVGAHHGALGDLVLLDVVEELGRVAIGAVVDAFVGVGPLDRLGLHRRHCARSDSRRKPTCISTAECGTVDV